jgi:hypothetical protein
MRPVVKSTFGANEILPLVLVFRNTEAVLLLVFDTTRSGFPSPSKSPVETAQGLLPVAKSTFDANEPAVMLPLALVF